MNKGEHLTEKQLIDYFRVSLENNKNHEIGRHLLQCDFCLRRLPQPTPEQFWEVLMTENDVNDKDVAKTDIPQRLGFVSGLLTPPKMLAWSAGGLAIALIFIGLIWFGIATSPSNEEREIAQVFDTEIEKLNQNEPVEENIPQNDLTSKSNNQTTSPGSPSPVVISKPTNLDLQKQNRDLSNENNSSRNSKKIIPSEELANISSTRGVSGAKCSEENSIEMEVGSNSNEGVVFSWTKVPNAVKYHLFVSDDEEILIEEYETEAETAFVLKKTLDSAKTYKWKIIVTLENGKTVIGESQKFTTKYFQTNQKKIEKKRNSEIRCSAKG